MTSQINYPCSVVEFVPSVDKGRHGFWGVALPPAALSSSPYGSKASSSALPEKPPRAEKLRRTPTGRKARDGKAAARGRVVARQGRERRQRTLSTPLGHVCPCQLMVSFPNDTAWRLYVQAIQIPSSPLAHSIQNGNNTSSKGRQRINRSGRLFWDYITMNHAARFQITELLRKHLRRGLWNKPLQFHKVKWLFNQVPKYQRFIFTADQG